MIYGKSIKYAYSICIHVFSGSGSLISWLWLFNTVSFFSFFPFFGNLVSSFYLAKTYRRLLLFFLLPLLPPSDGLRLRPLAGDVPLFGFPVFVFRLAPWYPPERGGGGGGGATAGAGLFLKLTCLKNTPVGGESGSGNRFWNRGKNWLFRITFQAY